MSAKDIGVGILSFFIGLFSVLSIAVAVVLPRIDKFNFYGLDNIDPVRANVGIATFLILLITLGLLISAKQHLKLPMNWLVLAFGYNVLFLIVRFTISPLSYTNSPTFRQLVFTGAIVCGLYLFGYYLIYKFFKGDFNKHIDKLLKKHTSESYRLFTFSAILFMFISLVRMSIGLLPFLSDTSASSYLKSVYSGNGLIMTFIIFGSIYMTILSFAQLGPYGKSAKQHQLFKNVFELGAFLIIIHHIIWVYYVDGLL